MDDSAILIEIVGEISVGKERKKIIGANCADGAQRS